MLFLFSLPINYWIYLLCISVYGYFFPGPNAAHITLGLTHLPEIPLMILSQCCPVDFERVLLIFAQTALTRTPARISFFWDSYDICPLPWSGKLSLTQTRVEDDARFAWDVRPRSLEDDICKQRWSGWFCAVYFFEHLPYQSKGHMKLRKILCLVESFLCCDNDHGLYCLLKTAFMCSAFSWLWRMYFSWDFYWRNWRGSCWLFTSLQTGLLFFLHSLPGFFKRRELAAFIISSHFSITPCFYLIGSIFGPLRISKRTIFFPLTANIGKWGFFEAFGYNRLESRVFLRYRSACF